ncbi:MAG: hypothetical protein AAF184_25635, partial [Pseudomonadota bacterium]
MTEENSAAHVPKEKAGGHLLRLLAESAAIFLSVLLAFVVDEWREDQREQREADAALNLVRAELTQNLAQLEALVPVRPKMLEGYLAGLDLLKKEGTFPSELPEFRTPDITSIAYELATDSGAVTTVAAEELLVIAQAYAAVDKVRENDIFLADRNAQIRYNDGEQYLSGFVYYINQANINEPVAIEA